jgi:hypothetical protein
VINPTFSISEEIYLHVARETAWRIFADVRRWPAWNPAIVDAQWLYGEPWKEGAVLKIRHKSLFNTIATSSATIRMAVPPSAAVWEASGPGMQTVYSARFRDDLGGCTLRAKHTYHGPGAIVARMLGSRQSRNLTNAMEGLKQFIEER